MLTFIGLASGALAIVMYAPYIRDMLKGTTHPHRASWLIWSSLGLIAFFSQLAKGATNSLWMTAAQTLGTMAVFILSIKFGTGGFSRLDRVSLLAAAFGIVLWYLTSDALYALLITIAVDAIGAALTAKKAYQRPESETLITWVLSAASGILGTLAVGALNPTLMLYPLYVFVANSCVITGILLGRRMSQASK